jgi:methionyl-tRNA formyltransferase
LNPWPSAYTKLNGKTLKIWEADVIEEDYHCACGSIADVTKDSLIIQTGEGALAVHSLQLEGKKRMDTASFLRGYSIEKGQLLGE